MYEYPDYLMHYGVKGMKWGIRKKAVSSGKKIKSKASSLNKKRISSYSKDYQETRTLCLVHFSCVQDRVIAKKQL